MRFNTTGHAAWIFAAGLCASAFLYPAAAQEAAQTPEQPAAVGTATGVTAAPAQPTRLHPKKSASKSRKAERQAKEAKAKKPVQAETAKADDLKPTQDDAMPPAVANANAQWAHDAKSTNTYNMTAQAGNVLSQMDAQASPATTAPNEDNGHTEQVVAADQVNDLDRAAAEQQPPLTLAKATIDTPSPAPSATVENTKPWEQTSLIGKVFIALGGLLTVASAARMFIA